MNNYRMKTGKADVTNDQARDTGMALVLLLLVIWFITGRDALVVCAVVLHVVNMTASGLFRPAAVVWFGLSHALGTIVSKVILALAFFLVVTPIGMLRRVLGFDGMQLKAFKAGPGSVMHRRDHAYTGKDIEAPY